jgi:hypothetical protein
MKNTLQTIWLGGACLWIIFATPIFKHFPNNKILFLVGTFWAGSGIAYNLLRKPTTA